MALIKAIYLWKGKHCAGGNLAATVAECVRMGINQVWLKIADGLDVAYESYPADKDHPGMMGLAVKAFRQAGIGVWGWHYVYGGVRMDKGGKVVSYAPGSAKLEARLGCELVRQWGLDGYIIDAEREWKAQTQKARAKEFMEGLRDGGMGAPVGLSSYRYPRLHMEFPWVEFLEGSASGPRLTVHMPQVYWGVGTAVESLNRSWVELKELVYFGGVPMLPVGRAYTGDGHAGFKNGIDLVPGEIQKFGERAEELGAVGTSFWSLDHLYLHEGGEERREAIRALYPTLPSPQPPVVERGELRMRVGVAALNLREGPGMQHRDIGDLVGNEVVTVLNVAGRDAWVYVEMEDGRRGWACAGLGSERYLTPVGE